MAESLSVGKEEALEMVKAEEQEETTKAQSSNNNEEQESNRLKTRSAKQHSRMLRAQTKKKKNLKRLLNSSRILQNSIRSVQEFPRVFFL